ncbi:MAG: ribonuclease Z [Thermoplasmata archaeon HGW-Thermoplasmata-1]|nr:MAG: ribonuclease Z [Thermoplasmata archaeon HGW-Thermoplasmata-1]
MAQLSITFLGTGGSWPSVERNVSATAIKRNHEILLFDCGEGTQRQIQRSNISYMRISKIFISHYHGDHFLGLAGLIQTMQLNDRKAPLYVYGPKGLNELVGRFLSLGYFKPAYEIIVTEVAGGDELHFDGYRILASHVLHNVPSLAYALVENERPGRFNKQRALELGVPEGPLFRKLQEGKTVTLKDGRSVEPSEVLGPARKGRKVTVSGDTVPCREIVELARESTVFVCDATFTDDLKERANEYGHCTAGQAAEIAKEAACERLFMIHISPRYKGNEAHEKEAREIFPKSDAPQDLEEFEVSYGE